MKQVGATVPTLEGAGSRVSGSSSFSAAGFPHLHPSSGAMGLVTAFPKFVAAVVDMQMLSAGLCVGLV